MGIKPFKIKVTPGQSAILQDFLFKIGYTWGCGCREIRFTDKPYLYFEDNQLTVGWKEPDFNSDPLPKMSFKIFENKYLL